MRRVIIPLLIVVVLLVAVQTVMRGKSSNPSSVKNFQGGTQSFVSQLNGGEVKSVLVNTTAETIQVTPTTGNGPVLSLGVQSMAGTMSPVASRKRRSDSLNA